ncbi:MAG: PAS domain-containing protein [Candidatus Margulisiibacteriota bacterium]|nr:PAS domain-containing protein [Candidatus Margulisiibacteriota bacterium]
MRRIFDRIPLFWKYLMMSLLIFVAFYLSFYFFTNRILVILKEALLIEVPLGIFKNDFVWFFIWAALLSMLLLMLMYVDLRYFLSRLNNHFKYAIARKKMIPNLEEFQSKDLFQDISVNANQMFSLFKNFDQMKSSRISMEITSIKALINVIHEGIIFVNQDKVVTHINHQAEELLRLIPGEIIGEAISRYITDQQLLDHLNTSLANDQKMTDIKLTIRETEFVNLTILPIKNKFGELVRAIIVFQKL